MVDELKKDFHSILIGERENLEITLVYLKLDPDGFVKDFLNYIEPTISSIAKDLLIVKNLLDFLNMDNMIPEVAVKIMTYLMRNENLKLNLISHKGWHVFATKYKKYII